MADTLYSVFHKFCPQCASALERNRDRCDCGYSFSGSHGDEVQSPLAQTVAEEKLYEDYLAARATQTAQAVIAAQAAHKSNPRDSVVAAHVQEALDAAEQARAELAAQTAKIDELMKQLERERPRETAAAGADAPRASADPPRASTVAPVAAATDRELPTPTVPAPRILKPALTARASEVSSAAQALQEELARLRAHSDRPIRATKLIKPQTPAPVVAKAPAPKPLAPPAAPRMANGTATERTKACPECSASLALTQENCACGYSFAYPRAATAKPERNRAVALDAPAINAIIDRAKSVKKQRQQAMQAAKAEKIKAARLARQAQKANAPMSPPPPPVSAPAPVGQSSAGDIDSKADTHAVAAERRRDDGERARVARLLKMEEERLRAVALANAQAEEAARRALAAEQAAREAEARRVAAEEAARRAVAEQARLAEQAAAEEARIAAAEAAAKAAEQKRLDEERRAAEIRNSQKDCPNCTSTLAKTARFCKCGYEFAEMTPFAMPGLSLDPSDTQQVSDLYRRGR